jgi:hypothetical protein
LFAGCVGDQWLTSPSRQTNRSGHLLYRHKFTSPEVLDRKDFRFCVLDFRLKIVFINSQNHPIHTTQNIPSALVCRVCRRSVVNKTVPANKLPRGVNSYGRKLRQLKAGNIPSALVCRVCRRSVVNKTVPANKLPRGVNSYGRKLRQLKAGNIPSPLLPWGVISNLSPCGKSPGNNWLGALTLTVVSCDKLRDWRPKIFRVGSLDVPSVILCSQVGGLSDWNARTSLPKAPQHDEQCVNSSGIERTPLRNSVTKGRGVRFVRGWFGCSLVVRVGLRKCAASPTAVTRRFAVCGSAAPRRASSPDPPTREQVKPPKTKLPVPPYSEGDRFASRMGFFEAGGSLPDAPANIWRFSLGGFSMCLSFAEKTPQPETKVLSPEGIGQRPQGFRFASVIWCSHVGGRNIGRQVAEPPPNMMNIVSKPKRKRSFSSLRDNKCRSVPMPHYLLFCGYRVPPFVLAPNLATNGGTPYPCIECGIGTPLGTRANALIGTASPPSAFCSSEVPN